MSDKQSVLLVLGYGCHLNEKYSKYLGKVGRYVIENHVGLVVVSGGFSQLLTAPNRTEAMAMEKEIAKITGVSGVEILREEGALTTIQNLVFSRSILRSKGILLKTHKLVIFCDAIRALKVAWLARLIYAGFEIEIETHQLSSVQEADRQVLMTIKDIFCYLFPLLEKIDNWLVERRRQKI